MIRIRYKCVDGWHTFTADGLPGLYVASRCLRTAMNDLEPSVRMLMRLDGLSA